MTSTPSSDDEALMLDLWLEVLQREGAFIPGGDFQELFYYVFFCSLHSFLYSRVVVPEGPFVSVFSCRLQCGIFEFVNYLEKAGKSAA